LHFLSTYLPTDKSVGIKNFKLPIDFKLSNYRRILSYVIIDGKLIKPNSNKLSKSRTKP